MCYILHLVVSQSMEALNSIIYRLNKQSQKYDRRISVYLVRVIQRTNVQIKTQSSVSLILSHSFLFITVLI